MIPKNHSDIHFYLHDGICVDLKRIGSESRIRTKRSKLLRLATIAKAILLFFIEIHRSPEMQALKEIEGGTSMDILKRAFLSYSRNLRKDIRSDNILHKLKVNR